jgi:hypothetical protein
MAQLGYRHDEFSGADTAMGSVRKLYKHSTCQEHGIEYAVVLHQGTRLARKERQSTPIAFFNMSLVGAAAAIKGFLKQLDMARDMATAGAVGTVFNSVLSDADNLLSLVDEELADVDRERHASLFTTTPMLRRKMEHLREALRSRTQLERESASPLREMPTSNNVLIRKLYEEHCAVCAAAGVAAPTPEGWVDLIEDMLR